MKYRFALRHRPVRYLTDRIIQCYHTEVNQCPGTVAGNVCTAVEHNVVHGTRIGVYILTRNEAGVPETAHQILGSC